MGCNYYSHSQHDVPSQFLITDPTIRQPGFDLIRSDQTILNRYRTGHGRCAATLYDWGIRDDPFCFVCVAVKGEKVDVDLYSVFHAPGTPNAHVTETGPPDRYF